MKGPLERASGWGRGSLRRRILLWMLWVALVPLVLMAVQGYHCARQAVVESARERLLGIASSRREWVDAWMRERLQDMEVIGHSRECVALMRSRESAGGTEHVRTCRYLTLFRSHTEAYESIRLFDLEGGEIAGAGGNPASRGGAGGGSMLDSAGAAPRGTRVTVLPPEGGGGDRGWLLVLTHLLRDDEERPTGVVRAEIDLRRTLEPILQDRAGLGRTGRVYLASSEGRLLTRPRPGGEGGEGFPELIESDGTRALRVTESGSGVYRDFRGRRVVGGWARMDSPAWGVIAEIDAAEALAWLGILKARAFLVGLAALVLIALLAVRLSRLLSAPMRQLSGAARRIAAGGWGAAVGGGGSGGLEISGSVEAEEVGRAMTQMLRSLEEAHHRRVQSESLAAVGQLSSTIAHEIRNPLSSVKMNLQALSRRVAGDRVHEELATIALDQVRSMERLLDDLLSYAKPVELHLAPTALHPLVEAVIAGVRSEASELGVRVRALDSTGGGRIALDPDRIRQVLANLLRNAIRAAGRGGTVACSAAWSGGGKGVRFEVTDSGPGIPAQAADRLFEPFFTTRPDGAGLGLAVVRKIVELHGGSVAASNREPTGACFVVEIPGQPGQLRA